MKLETKRLVLRNWLETDYKELYNLAKEKEIGLNCGWLPHTSLKNSQEILKKCLMKDLTFAITLNKKIIGCISIMLKGESDITDDNSAEIGYWLGKPYWNNSFMHEALAEIINYSFNTLNLEKIYACYFTNNERSKNAQIKCGFKYDKKIDNYYVKNLSEYREVIVNVLYNEKHTKN